MDKLESTSMTALEKAAAAEEEKKQARIADNERMIRDQTLGLGMNGMPYDNDPIRVYTSATGPPKKPKHGHRVFTACRPMYKMNR